MFVSRGPTSSRIPPANLCTWFLLLFYLIHVTQAADFVECFARLHRENITDGGTFSDGRPAPIQNATGITYRVCLDECGAEQEPFSWNTFSQQFSAWLLPWLALISQLPFGANVRVHNLTSVLLTVGSPTLAAYSLAITALNGNWVARRFQALNYPNAKKMSRILAGLQQAPLKVNQDKALLASLVVLPENDEWFTELTTFIDFEHTWSISAATNIAWVLVAYLFTVADSFDDVTRMINSNGQAVGSLWLWLVPIVVGWLQIAPKIESNRLTIAMVKANQHAHVATSQSGVTRTFATNIPQDKRALSLASPDTHWVHKDEVATAPIFNYARFLPWSQVVEEVASAYRHASEKISHNLPVDDSQAWLEATSGPSKRTYVMDENRRGTLEQVKAYCTPSTPSQQVQDPTTSDDHFHYPPTLNNDKPPVSPSWSPGVFKRALVASIMALSLQWATTGSAIIMVWFTPTTGLACRSGAYLGYGILSTLVWLMMVSSSFLFHAASLRRQNTDPAFPDPRFSSPWFLRLLSTILRRLGKAIAAVNAVGILVVCVAQFSHLFDTCYCNSSVIYWGAEHAFSVIKTSVEDASGMRSAWVGALAMALTCAVGFVGFVGLYAETPSQTDS